MKPSPARVAKKWKNLPPGWTDKSVKKFWKTLGKGTPEHKVWDCIEKMTDNISNPGAFCGGLADWQMPGWRQKNKKESPDARSDAKSYWKGKIKKKKKGSTNTDQEFYKATDGKWYVENESFEEDWETGEQIEGEVTHYGPFTSEEAAEKYMRDNFSNPGQYWTDNSGRRRPPRNPKKPGRGRHNPFLRRRWASTPNAASVALRWSMRS